MLFNSYEFIFVFLPLSLLVYFSLARLRFTKLATASLVLASLMFYSYWNISYLPLLLSSILFNYTIGKKVEKSKSKGILIFGVAVNLILLGYYKYTGFFLNSINEIAGGSFVIPNIILPLGISFFTFTQTAYLVDAYRGETKNYDLLTYSLFVTVFPHLIAGPILHHKDTIPQFSRLRNFIFSYKNFALGISVFSIGLFKKVIIADRLAPWVKIVFDNANSVTFFEAWVGALGYTLQLYYDFSGYSEMAIGLGLMFNLKLPINFNSPYKATSIIDFWRRWHISLSVFLRNYLYIPLGGNRNGEIKRIRNLMLTMLLGGLWHGAGWTYVIWGGLHGCFLVINHTWRRFNLKLPRALAWLLTFLSIVIAWVFFRADSVNEALQILSAMLGMKGFILPNELFGQSTALKKIGLQFQNLKFLTLKGQEVFVILSILLMTAFIKEPIVGSNFRPNWKWVLRLSLIATLSLLVLNKVSEFLYFQF